MTSASDATAAPIEVTVAGEQYRAAPLTVRDMGEWERREKQLAINQGREAIKDDGLSRDDKSMILDKAFRASERITMDSLVNNITFDRAATMLWLCLRHHHPNIDRDEIADKLTMHADGELQSVVSSLLKISGITENEDDDPALADGSAEKKSVD